MSYIVSHCDGQYLMIEPTFKDDLAAENMFDACMQLAGETVRAVAMRRTVRFSLEHKVYYAKIHRGVGWREIIKNLVRLSKPVLGAGDEQRAIQRVTQLGIRTTPLVAFGQRGCNPATMQSFLVTRDVGPTVSLETVAEQAAVSSLPPHLKRQLVNQVADIARTLHTNGINHRDLYLCHFEMDRDALRDERARIGKLILMDLHRAQIRSRTPRRWIVKDLAALLFSSLDAPITPRDLLRFARQYRGGHLKRTLAADQRLWRDVWHRAMKLYRAHWDRQPASMAYQRYGGRP